MIKKLLTVGFSFSLLLSIFGGSSTANAATSITPSKNYIYGYDDVVDFTLSWNGAPLGPSYSYTFDYGDGEAIKSVSKITAYGTKISHTYRLYPHYGSANNWKPSLRVLDYGTKAGVGSASAMVSTREAVSK